MVKVLHRPRALRLHQGDDRRGVDPAREEGAERHVGHHPQPDRVAQQRLQRSTASSAVPANGSRARARRRLARRPVRRSSVGVAAASRVDGERCVAGGSLRTPR